MTIDELIEKHRYMETKGNILFPQRPDIAEKSNMQYKETADYLEELKELRRIKEDYAKGMQYSYATFMYSKAVDDTVKAIKKEYAFTILEEEKIDEIAEQLKGAKRNEDSKQEEIQ